MEQSNIPELSKIFHISTAFSDDPAIQLIENRTQIIDALYRFGAGQDLHDSALFESAFAVDSVLDFSRPAKRLGAEMLPLRGRDNIVQTIMGAVSTLHTTHTVSNMRVLQYGDKALLMALVEAQHVPMADPEIHLLLKNRYAVSLVKAERCWQITDMQIDLVWMTGQAKVLFGDGKNSSS